MVHSIPRRYPWCRAPPSLPSPFCSSQKEGSHQCPSRGAGTKPRDSQRPAFFLLEDLAALTDSLLVSLSFDTSRVPYPALPAVTSRHACLTSLYSPRLVAGYDITDQTQSNPIPPAARTVTASDPRPQPPGLLLLPFLHFLSPTLMRPLALQ